MPDVIIPVLNEAAALPALIAAVPAGYKPIVVDNGSTDGSATVARRCGAVVVTESARGFGAACWTGLLAAAPADDVVCFMDGDGSFDAGELEKVAGPVLEHRADLVLGARRPVARGAWPLHAQLANTALTLSLRRRIGIRLHDLGPMRAAPWARLIDLAIQDRRFGWPLEMVLRAADAGWSIVEVPVSYRPRTGRSKVTGTALGTTRAVLDMARVRRALA
jgi:glycosyltransferase involved in cell wall biosynthesis